MRRITWITALVLCLTVVLAGCGKKDAGTVVKDLDHKVGKLESYQGTGRMVLNTGQQPQEYQVEVWYKNPHFYRISLTNAKKDITQIVLRNDEGVFVLTPHLNKSFRFQSDWPDNQGQVYLYQSLVQSIVSDNHRQFTTDANDYVFDVLANYQNSSLSRQKIWLSKKNYAPRHVEVSDENANVMVVVDFDKFEFGKKFDANSFDMQKNLTGSNPSSDKQTGSAAGSVPSAPASAGAAGVTGKAGTDAKAKAGANGQAAAGKDSGADGKFAVIDPGYMPKGVAQQDVSDIKLGDDAAVMLRYTGTYHYSIVESRPQAKEVLALPGKVLDLGFTLGSLTGDEKRTLTWTYDGVEFKLSTADLPTSEMIKVAQAMQAQSMK